MHPVGNGSGSADVSAGQGLSSTALTGVPTKVRYPVDESPAGLIPHRLHAHSPRVSRPIGEVMPLPTSPVGAAEQQAADWIADADALVIGAGAGMSVASGLSVYYGSEGRYSGETVAHASAEWFDTDPEAAIAHALSTRREIMAVEPHPGYSVLRGWAQQTQFGAAVLTSNVDGLFLRAGFNPDSVYETHGSHLRSQCLGECGEPSFVNAENAPQCPSCAGPARPNVLMFGDFRFHDSHRSAQWDSLARWFDTVPEDSSVVVIEIGAGTTVPVVRRKCETYAHAYGWPLIRINTDQPECLTPDPPANFASLQGDAAAVLMALDARVTDRRVGNGRALGGERASA